MSDEAIRRQLRRSAITLLIEWVMKKESVSLPDAMKIVYDSKLYGLIEDELTGLYREGPVYLYDMLCEERGSAQSDSGGRSTNYELSH